jgi:hypothetical protein
VEQIEEKGKAQSFGGKCEGQEQLGSSRRGAYGDKNKRTLK